MCSRITFDPGELDLEAVFAFLHDEAYWSRGRTREVFDASIEGSALVLGAIDDQGRTLGFARVVSDRATFAWLCDVFVFPAFRGVGLGHTLVEAAITHSYIAGVKRHLLATTDAHGLYAEHGFRALDTPARWMERIGADT